MTKDEIRAIVKERRCTLGADWFVQVSARIQNAAVELVRFKEAEIVCAYMALPHEVQTDVIFKAVWDSGKKLCVPALRSDGCRYALSELLPDTRVIEGGGGVFEPEAPRWIDINDVDIAFVPGVAFDHAGGRIGHGCGHIDRMLVERTKKKLFKVGLAYQFQLFEEVPQSEFDVRMDLVVSEEEY